MDRAERVRTLFGWGVFRVRGHSMAPDLKDGDFAVFRRLAGNAPLRPGSIVLVDHPGLGLIVKTLGPVDDDGRFSLSGKSSLSSAPEAMGTVARDAIMGRVVGRVPR